MEDVFKFLLVAAVIVFGLVRQLKKEAKKNAENKPVVPMPPETDMDAHPFPPHPYRRGTYGGYIPEGPRMTEESEGEKISGAVRREPFKAAASSYAAIQPQASPPVSDAGGADETSEYGIHSIEEARRAVIWSEILQRKY